MPFAEQTLAVRVKSTGVDSFRTAIDSAAGSLGNLKTTAGLAAGALGAIGFAAVTKEAADFEQAMVEVRKVTAEGVGEALADDVRDMASEIPIAQEALAGLTADAARFGVEGEENIRQFVEVTARMATATNLNADEAGEALAKLATITDTPITQVENLGSSVNALSNSMATSAQEIVDGSLRSSAALSQMGADQTEIFALSASLNEVSSSSRRAGTRLRRLAQEMMNPKKASDIANAMGMSVEEFQRMQEEDPTAVIMQMAEAFASGGEQADALRANLSTASRQAVAGLAQNVDGLNEALGRSEEEFQRNQSLQEEFDKAVNTTKNQFQLLKNQISNAAITSGSVFLPIVTKVIQGLGALVRGFSAINEATNGFAGAIIIGGALLTGLVTVIGMASGVITGTLVPAFLTGAGAITGLGSSALAAIPGMSGLAASINAATLPLLAVIAFIGTLIGVIALLASNAGGLRDRWFNIWQEIKFETLSVIDTIIGAINTVLDAIPGIGTQLDTVLGDTSKREFLAQRTREVGSGEDFTGGLGGTLEGAAGGVMDLLGGGIGGGAGGGAGGLAAAAGAGGAAGGGRMNELQQKLDASVSEMENTSSNIDQGIKETSEKIGEVTEKQESREVQRDRRVAEAAGGAAAGAGATTTRERGGTELDVDVTFDTTDDTLEAALRDIIDVRVARKDQSRNRDIRRRGRKA